MAQWWMQRDKVCSSDGGKTNKYVASREGWTSIVINKLLYGCVSLAWYQQECDDLEIGRERRFYEYSVWNRSSLACCATN